MFQLAIYPRNCPAWVIQGGKEIGDEWRTFVYPDGNLGDCIHISLRNYEARILFGPGERFDIRSRNRKGAGVYNRVWCPPNLEPDEANCQRDPERETWRYVKPVEQALALVT